jgi:hypothetical protein
MPISTDQAPGYHNPAIYRSRSPPNQSPNQRPSFGPTSLSKMIIQKSRCDAQDDKDYEGPKYPSPLRVVFARHGALTYIRKIAHRDRRKIAHRGRTGWLGRLDSNQGMAESKSAALPLGYAPMHGRIAAGVRLWPGANITAPPPRINDGPSLLVARSWLSTPASHPIMPPVIYSYIMCRALPPGGPKEEQWPNLSRSSTTTASAPFG